MAEAIRINAIGARIRVDAPLSLSDVRTLFASTGLVVNKVSVSVANFSPVAVDVLKDEDTLCAPYLPANKAWWIFAEEVVT